ncbi:MAG: shikimate dehydrogenase [Thermoleophilaceae bacterium]
MGRTLLGIAGFPVAHSRSPAMQNAALRELELDWLYVALPLVPERFAETASSLAASGYRGINVTIPHKAAAHDLADERTAAATAIGAANTLTYEDGRIEADNTDAGGLLDALGWSGGAPAGVDCLVLGAGGSAGAAAWALREAGAARVSVWNRTAERAADLAADLGVRHADRPRSADLIVNCTSVGLGGEPPGQEAALGAVGLAGIGPPATFCDLVYGSEPTALARWAERGGSRVVDGLEVLVRQGARSLERWTERPAPVDAMRAAARAS